jgi:predicted MPP superfamily phosphohydrolase
MALFFKILILLWLINFTPPLLAHILEDKWNGALDRGRLFRDGKPLLGDHKTTRGCCGAVIAGTVLGAVFGLSWWVGFLSAVLSMLGDLGSSFLKRRMGMRSGNVVPGLDQIFEGAFPFLVLSPVFSLGMLEVGTLVTLFSIGAFVGSWFFKVILLMKPYADYPRPVRPRTRLKELRSCQITSHPFHHFLNIEDSIYYHIFMKTVFRFLGIYEKGKQNALQLETCSVSFHLDNLPASFDNYTILFISDLHLDGLEGLTEKAQSVVKGLPVDLCIIGGDLRMETHGPFGDAMLHLERLIPDIQTKDGIIGILGNHDCTEIIEPMGKLGVEFLVNDAKPIRRNGEEIWIVGVDDPHYYKCHDLEMAFSGVPSGAFTIFAAHSNEIYKEAAQYGSKLYLCGHSHAGQIQVRPWGPIFTHSRAPRRLCWGSWDYRGMLGYTSGGVGVSGVPVRFCSRGELSLITLKKK